MSGDGGSVQVIEKDREGERGLLSPCAVGKKKKKEKNGGRDGG